MNVVVVNVV